MAIVEILRKDPQSRFFGVPQDLTNIITSLVRSLGRPLREIKRQQDGQVLGLTLDDHLIVQKSGSFLIQLLSLPHLTNVGHINLPWSIRVCPLSSGEYVCFNYRGAIQYQKQHYYFFLTTPGLEFRSDNQRTNTDSRHDPGDPSAPPPIVQISLNIIAVTPAGKIYLVHQNTIYETDLAGDGSVQPLFSVEKWEGVQDVFVQAVGNTLYFGTNYYQVAYHLITQEITMTTYPHRKYQRMIVDPGTQEIHPVDVCPTTWFGNIENASFSNDFHTNYWVTRQGDVVGANYDSFTVYGY